MQHTCTALIIWLIDGIVCFIAMLTICLFVCLHSRMFFGFTRHWMYPCLVHPHRWVGSWHVSKFYEPISGFGFYALTLKLFFLKTSVQCQHVLGRFVSRDWLECSDQQEWVRNSIGAMTLLFQLSIFDVLTWWERADFRERLGFPPAIL